VAFLKIFRVAAELVLEHAPRMLALRIPENVPGFLDLRAFADRHHLQRPDEDLPEMADRLGHPTFSLV
jgi:hypothetical protein